MKNLFTEPSLELERFAVTDSTLNNLFLSGFLPGEDELDPVTGAYGTTPAIG